MRIQPASRKMVSETLALSPRRGCAEEAFDKIERLVRVLCVTDAAKNLAPALTVVTLPLLGERADQTGRIQRNLPRRKSP